MARLAHLILAVVALTLIGAGPYAMAAGPALLSPVVAYDPSAAQRTPPPAPAPAPSTRAEAEGRRDGAADGRQPGQNAGGPQGAPELRYVPPDQGQNPNRRWRLGVGIANLDTGVRITAVEPNSPAGRTGLERNDIIIAVNGQQVGQVLNQVVDLGDVLHSAAGPDGRVRLLLQNHRDSRLLNVDVRLEPWGPGGGENRNAVTGTVSYRERIAIPANAVLNIRLIKRGGFLSPQRVIAERSYRVGQPPISFELPYNPNELSNRETYFVEADISVFKEPWFTTRETYEVITHGNPTQVEIWVERTQR